MNPLEQHLYDALTAQIQQADFRVRLASDMWVIEAIFNTILDEQTKHVVLQNIHRTILENGDQKNIWKFFGYENANDRFTENATLHTIEQEWRNGMLSTTLSGLDCYLDISQFDSEVLQLHPRPGHIILGKESLDDQDRPILPFQQGAPFRWLECLGGAYGVQTTVTRDNQGIVSITLQ